MLFFSVPYRVRKGKQERRKEKESEGGRESKIVKTVRKRGFEKAQVSS